MLRVGDTKVSERSSYPLTLIVKGRKTFEIELQHDRRRYDPTAMTSLLNSWERVLAAMAETPARPVAHLWSLPAREQAVVVEQPNETARAYPSGTLPALIEAQVARTPHGGGGDRGRACVDL